MQLWSGPDFTLVARCEWLLSGGAHPPRRFTPSLRSFFSKGRGLKPRQGRGTCFCAHNDFGASGQPTRTRHGRIPRAKAPRKLCACSFSDGVRHSVGGCFCVVASFVAGLPRVTLLCSQCVLRVKVGPLEFESTLSPFVENEKVDLRSAMCCPKKMSSESRLWREKQFFAVGLLKGACKRMRSCVQRMMGYHTRQPQIADKACCHGRASTEPNCFGTGSRVTKKASAGARSRATFANTAA